VQFDCHFNVSIHLLFSYVVAGALLFQKVHELFLNFGTTLDLLLLDIRHVAFVVLAVYGILVALNEFGYHLVD